MHLSLRGHLSIPLDKMGLYVCNEPKYSIFISMHCYIVNRSFHPKLLGGFSQNQAHYDGFYCYGERIGVFTFMIMHENS